MVFESWQRPLVPSQEPIARNEGNEEIVGKDSNTKHDEREKSDSETISNSDDESTSSTPETRSSQFRESSFEQVFVHLSCFKCCVNECLQPWISTGTQDFYMDHEKKELFCIPCYKLIFQRRVHGYKRRFAKSVERKISLMGRPQSPVFRAKTMTPDEFFD